MGEIVVVPLGRRNACRRPKIAENRRRHARRASPDARKGFFESLSRPHSHARPHERRRGTHGVPLDPSVERSRRQRSSRRRRAPTARGPGSQRHAVDFGFVENLLRRRACSLPAAEVSPALARDAIGAAASRARGGRRTATTELSHPNAAHVSETDHDRSLEPAIAPREPTSLSV